MPVEVPKEKWSGSVRQVTIGATAEQGGTRSRTLTIGGGEGPALPAPGGGLPHPPRPRGTPPRPEGGGRSPRRCAGPPPCRWR